MSLTASYNSVASQTYFAHAVYCARRKEGKGENTSGVFGRVFVCTAGMCTNQIAASGNQLNII